MLRFRTLCSTINIGPFSLYLAIGHVLDSRYGRSLIYDLLFWTLDYYTIYCALHGLTFLMRFFYYNYTYRLFALPL